MLIPSIDLMGGKIVQLVQGEKKALEFDDFEPWVERFSKYPLVQLIDLDAARQTGDNRDLVEQFARRLPCQVGGGIRTLETAQQVLAAGARRVILGSALVRDGCADTGFAQQISSALGAGKLVFAVDSRGGSVAIQGWRQATQLSPTHMMRTLEPWCGAFLYTHIDTEGLLQGIPLEVVAKLRSSTSRQLMVAGGIASTEEVERLHAMKVDAVAGMAIYTGRMAV